MQCAHSAQRIVEMSNARVENCRCVVCSSCFLSRCARHQLSRRVWLRALESTHDLHSQTGRYSVLHRVAPSAELSRHRALEWHTPRLCDSSRPEIEAVSVDARTASIRFDGHEQAAGSATHSQYTDTADYPSTRRWTTSEMALACHRWQSHAHNATQWWLWIDDCWPPRR